MTLAGAMEGRPTGQRFAPCDPPREAGAQTNQALLTAVVPIATFCCDVPARCAAFADELRIVAGDGRRVRTRNALSAVMPSHVAR